MNILTEVQNNLIRTSKGKLVVNPAFDVVLEIQNLYRESELTDFEKINCALKMLVKNDWNLKKYTPTEKISLLEEIYKKCIIVKKRPQTKKSALPMLDFEEDGDYIYASFMQEYGIDLIDQQGKLPWRKFLWLFNGLGADTKIKQVMHIREMEIPQLIDHCCYYGRILGGICGYVWLGEGSRALEEILQRKCKEIVQRADNRPSHKLKEKEILLWQ